MSEEKRENVGAGGRGGRLGRVGFWAQHCHHALEHTAVLVTHTRPVNQLNQSIIQQATEIGMWKGWWVFGARERKSRVGGG